MSLPSPNAFPNPPSSPNTQHQLFSISIVDSKHQPENPHSAPPSPPSSPSSPMSSSSVPIPYRHYPRSSWRQLPSVPLSGSPVRHASTGVDPLLPALYLSVPFSPEAPDTSNYAHGNCQPRLKRIDCVKPMCLSGGPAEEQVQLGGRRRHGVKAASPAPRGA